jgi:hypothetical protein
MSDSDDMIVHEIEGSNLFTPEVIQILQKTYACAVGVLGGMYVDMPQGTATKQVGESETTIPVAGIVFGTDLIKAPPRVRELVFELIEIAQYPPEAVAEIKKILDAQKPKESAVTFLSEV